jgi:hypothetical protein
MDRRVQLNRRGFLTALGLVVVPTIIKPTYFFAPVKGWGPVLQPIFDLPVPLIPQAAIDYTIALHHYAEAICGSLRTEHDWSKLRRMHELPKDADRDVATGICAL